MKIKNHNLLLVLIGLLGVFPFGKAFPTSCDDTFSYERLHSTSFKSTVRKFKDLKRKISHSNGIIKNKYKEILIPLVSSGTEEWILTHRLLTNTPVSYQRTLQQLPMLISKSQVIAIEHTVMKKINKALPQILRLRKRILINDRNINSIYKDIEGQARFAKEYFGGNLKEAYDEIATALNIKTFNQLRWIRLSLRTRICNILLRTVKSVIGYMKDAGYKEIDSVTLIEKFNEITRSNNGTINAWLLTLKPREEFIFRWRFMEDTPLTLLQLAERFSTTKSRIHQIQQDAIRKIMIRIYFREASSGE